MRLSAISRENDADVCVESFHSLADMKADSSSSIPTQTQTGEADLSFCDRSERNKIAEQLVPRCLAGDPHAWSTLVLIYRGMIFNCCYSFTRSHSDSEDYTQDVFTKIFCNLSKYDPQRSSLSSWIWNMTQHLLIDRYRAAQSRGAGKVSSLDGLLSTHGESSLARFVVDRDPGPEQNACRLERLRLLGGALRQLQPSLREVIVSYDLNDQPPAETARLLGVHEGTIRTRRSRARKQLVELFAAARVTTSPRVNSRTR
jgi:RNA polymerase sigma-70 factor, ECF subfamily